MSGKNHNRMPGAKGYRLYRYIDEHRTEVADMTDAQAAEVCAKALGVTVSKSNISHARKQLGLPRRRKPNMVTNSISLQDAVLIIADSLSKMSKAYGVEVDPRIHDIAAQASIEITPKKEQAA